MPPPRSRPAIVVRDNPVLLAICPREIDRLRRRARSWSHNVFPGPKPVRRKSSASITAISVATDPTPFSSRLMVWASTPTRSANVCRDQPSERLPAVSSSIRFRPQNSSHSDQFFADRRLPVNRGFATQSQHFDPHQTDPENRQSFSEARWTEIGGKLPVCFRVASRGRLPLVQACPGAGRRAAMK